MSRYPIKLEPCECCGDPGYGVYQPEGCPPRFFCKACLQMKPWQSVHATRDPVRWAYFEKLRQLRKLKLN